MADTKIEILTVGHSTLPYKRFLMLLQQFTVSAVADVRTFPYSRHFPHFNRDLLRDELSHDNIAYVFLGNELGGRPRERGLFLNGIADYERMATTGNFARGLRRVTEGAKKYRIAMMCSEHDPLDCHRCLLVGRALHERGVRVRHILGNGRLVDHYDMEVKLMELTGRSNVDLFEPPAERLAAAYRDRAAKVAYVERTADQHMPAAVE